MSTPTFEATIGLEVHAQLLTRTKLFCGCEATFGAPPNTHVCPVCLGLPGALPVLNREAVRMGVRAARALGLTILPRSIFARKNYFYPDLPKGYQITQYDRPFSEDGALEIAVPGAGPKIARIQRIHLEEDAGKSLHEPGRARVDLNRAGVPLIEIVGHPDLSSGEEAAIYLRALRDVLVCVGVNDGNLEEGSFRCDANVSIRPVGRADLGARVELKNINSFRFVERAIGSEIARQRAVLETGGTIAQETRGWDEATGTTFAMRSKEEAHDYRYFPDPDLPPLDIDLALVREIDRALPELPAAKRARYMDSLGLPRQAAEVLTSHPRLSAFYEDALAAGADPVKAANFVGSEVLREARAHGLAMDLPVRARDVARLLTLVEEGTISGKQAKAVFARMCGTGKTPDDVVAELGLSQILDPDEIRRLCVAVVAANEKSAIAWRAGKKALLGFFVGQVMKASSGRANPALVNEILVQVLSTVAEEP